MSASSISEVNVSIALYVGFAVDTLAHLWLVPENMSLAGAVCCSTSSPIHYSLL